MEIANESHRSIELTVEVVGTPETVWTAIATGPGISSWYVPHVVEERTGGAATASFGEGPEMQMPGRVKVWEPPRRIVFDGGEGVGGLEFEWLVEPGSNGTCIVRLVNSGFGSGDMWDDQYDQMVGGWGLFMSNLQAHLAHFAGQPAKSMLPSGMWNGSRGEVWLKLLGALGIPLDVEAGARMVVAGADAPPLAGTVMQAHDGRITLLLDTPCAGTALIAAEGTGEQTMVSVWSYLYGPERGDIVARDTQTWQQWLDDRAP